MFLEILTRHFVKRPNFLQEQQASLDTLLDTDWQQTLLIDDVGYGVPWANRQLGAYAPQLEGDYIWILDDDDECIYPQLIDDLKGIVEAHRPDIIMLRCAVGTQGILPPDNLWGQKPEFARIAMSGFVIRREIYQAFAEAWPNTRGGDHRFISTVYAVTPVEKIYWHDVVAMKIQWKGMGRPEKSK